MDSNLQSFLALINSGPVSVVVDPDSTNVELFVDGGINLSLTRGLQEVQTDVLGVYDLRSTGDGATFDLAVPELSKNVLDVLFADMADGTTYRGFGNSAGKSQRSVAKKVRIRPWQTRTSATNQVEFWKCTPAGDATLGMNKDGNYIFTQPMRALPDATKTDGQLVAKFTLASRS